MCDCLVLQTHRSRDTRHVRDVSAVTLRVYETASLRAYCLFYGYVKIQQFFGVLKQDFIIKDVLLILC